MYEFIDRPVTTLDHGGRFLVWSMRSWVKSMHGCRCPCNAIGPAFAKWNMIAGLQHFHMMMTMFNREALESFYFGPLECNRVREHEALIVNMIQEMRADRAAGVRATLKLLVQEDAVVNLMTAIAALSHAMAEAGIVPGKPAHAPYAKGCTHE